MSRALVGDKHWRGVLPVPSGARLCQEQGAAPLTLEEIDSLIAVVAVGGEGERCVHVVGDALKALGDVPWVPRVQGSVIKAPVLGALEGGGQRGITGATSPSHGSARRSERMLGSPVLRLWLPGAPKQSQGFGVSGNQMHRRCQKGI